LVAVGLLRGSWAPPAAVAAPAGGGGAPSAAGPAAGAQAPAAPAARPPLEPAKDIVTSISISATPLYLARDLGFWAEEGIDPELVLVPGAATPAQALVAGE